MQPLFRLPGTYISPAETGLYYLNSRYYDPETGRFINADGLVSTGQGVLGYNMFAYCGNNPIIYSDASGFGRISTFMKNLVDETVKWISTSQNKVVRSIGRTLSSLIKIARPIREVNEAKENISLVSNINSTVTNGLNKKTRLSEDVVNIGFANTNNAPIDKTTLLSPEQSYIDYCSSVYDGLAFSMEGMYGTSIRSMRWNDLSTETQTNIIACSPQWAKEFVWDDAIKTSASTAEQYVKGAWNILK